MPGRCRFEIDLLDLERLAVLMQDGGAHSHGLLPVTVVDNDTRVRVGASLGTIRSRWGAAWASASARSTRRFAILPARPWRGTARRRCRARISMSPRTR